MKALRIGEASIKVFHSSDIFDVVKIKVVSSILPHSPVYIHQGGEIYFKYDEGTAHHTWSTGDHNIVSIDSYGQAIAKNLGWTAIEYAGDANLKSNVYVKRVGDI